MRTRIGCLLVSCLLLSIGMPAQTNNGPEASRLATLRAAAAQADPMPLLEQLTDSIGPRLTGSPALEQAGQLVLAHMREIGLANVHSEAWTLPRAWQRGDATAALVHPFHLRIPIAAYAWTGSTPQHEAEVPVVLVDTNETAGDLDTLVRDQGSRWAGKVLLLSSNPDKPMHAYAQLLPFLREATRAHAIAVLRHDTRPGAGVLHSEPVAVRLPSAIDTTLIPALDTSSEHQQLLEHLLEQHQSVTLRIAVHNSFSAAPVECHNFIAEIPGTLYPEQVILVGAHLDSWDLGTGATDDGFGAAAVLGAAQAIARSGLKPARTLRFVLFTGEEQGLLGSRAYVLQHAAELPGIVTAFALDWGAGPITRMPTAGHAELLPLFQQLNQLAPELNLEPPDNGWLFMTDAYAFSLAGIPGIAPLIKDSGYFEHAHSAQDTLDKVSAADLKQATSVLAVSSFFLADVPELPVTHQTREQAAAAMISGKQRPMLEVFGLWPFNN